MTQDEQFEAEIEPLMDQVSALCEKYNIPMLASFATMKQDKEGGHHVFIGEAPGADMPASMQLALQIMQADASDGSAAGELLQAVADKGMPVSVSVEQIDIGDMPDALSQLLANAMPPDPTCDCPSCTAKRSMGIGSTKH